MNGKRQRPIILSIGGGKGGVGKSLVSSNLAVHYAKQGLKVVAIDLDMGAANLHTIFGIRQPERSLSEFLMANEGSLSDYLVDTSLQGVQIIAGSGFVPELANMKHAQKVRIIQAMRELDADLLLLDLGAGSSNNIVDFFSMTSGGVVVTTPEPTALLNGYEFLKNVTYRILFRILKSDEELHSRVKKEVLSRSEGEGDTIDQVLSTIAAKKPFLAKSARELLSDLDFYLIFNQAKRPKDLELFSKLQEICKRYLGISLNISGVIYNSQEVPISVLNMTPISLSHPDGVTSRCLKRHANNILNSIVKREKTGFQEPLEGQIQRARLFAEQDFIDNLLAEKREQQLEERGAR